MLLFASTSMLCIPTVRAPQSSAALKMKPYLLCRSPPSPPFLRQHGIHSPQAWFPWWLAWCLKLYRTRKTQASEAGNVHRNCKPFQWTGLREHLQETLLSKVEYRAEQRKQKQLPPSNSRVFAAWVSNHPSVPDFAIKPLGCNISSTSVHFLVILGGFRQVIGVPPKIIIHFIHVKTEFPWKRAFILRGPTISRNHQMTQVACRLQWYSDLGQQRGSWTRAPDTHLKKEAMTAWVKISMGIPGS